MSSTQGSEMSSLCVCWCVSTGQCHMYIHTMEMSPHPDAALEAAHALRGVAPDSGHLNHMPGHIFTLCGPFFTALSVRRVKHHDKLRSTPDIRSDTRMLSVDVCVCGTQAGMLRRLRRVGWR